MADLILPQLISAGWIWLIVKRVLLEIWELSKEFLVIEWVEHHLTISLFLIALIFIFFIVRNNSNIYYEEKKIDFFND